MFDCNVRVLPQRRLFVTALFWEFYEEKLAAGGERYCRVNKLIYTNTIVHSYPLRRPVVRRAGFRTAVYHSALHVQLFELGFAFVREENEGWAAIVNCGEFRVEVVGTDAYLLSEHDEDLMDGPVSRYEAEL
ncbi:hypothetical protein RvY_02668 [Ramazzottius varieornatus]|uniref:Uncharacterized protein n=1 Tax=Ramazzottius varieornatus TaxID=947166 RepID=A0A1D1UVN5_RAMVA|nr:hypothetical protein RvY_02668 [Ramazzottius varieornatus]